MEETTRKRGTDTASLLDLILSNEEDQVSEIQHFSPIGKSDHDVITFNYHCYLDFGKPKEVYVYSKGDYASMRSELDKIDWQKWFREQNFNAVEECWAAIKKKLLELEEKYVPKKKLTGKPSWKKGIFPINKASQEAIKDKHKKHRSWMRSKQCDDGEEAHNSYKKARNKVRRLLRNAKRAFEKNISRQAKTNPKVFWGYARQNLKSKAGISPLLQDKKEPLSLQFDDEAKANILQRQFSSVFTNEPHNQAPDFNARTNTKLERLTITIEMVLEALKSLNLNKSSGADYVHA